MSLPARAVCHHQRDTSRPAIALSLIETPAGFLALEREWNSLFARVGRPHQLFQSHVMLRHWLSHYLCEGDRLAVICARREGRLVMAWPLVRQRRLGFVTLRFMGGPIAQFSDVLAEDEPDLLAAGWQAVMASGADMLEIRKLRDDARLAVAAFPTEVVVTEREQAPFAECDRRVGADGPGPAYSPRDRSNHRRRLRRLSELGDVVVSAVEPGPSAAMMAREAVGLKRRGLAGQGIFSRPWPTRASRRSLPISRETKPAPRHCA